MRRILIAIVLLSVVSGALLVLPFLMPEQAGPSPAFRIQVKPDPVSLRQGDQASIHVTVVPENNFNSAVSLNLFDNPSGISGSWSQSVVGPFRRGAMSTSLSLTVEASVPAQNYSLGISGTGEGLTTTASLTVSVLQLPPGPIFDLAVSPPSLRVDQGQSALANVTVTSENGFNSPVTVSVSSIPGVETGLNMTDITPRANGNSTVSLSVTVSSSATPGSYSLTVMASNSSFARTRILGLSIPPPMAFFYLTGWTGGWNSSIPTGQPACAPSSTPNCNPDLNVLVGQKFTVTFESFDGAHNIAYYPSGYPADSVPLPGPGTNPDAINRSAAITLGEPAVALIHRFDVPGTYEYYCEFHSATQHGEVIVSSGSVGSLSSNETVTWNTVESDGTRSELPPLEGRATETRWKGPKLPRT